MRSKFWKSIFALERPSRKKEQQQPQLSIKDRLIAFKNIPRFIKLVWQTNPWLTIITGFLRISFSVLPISMLYIGKYIIDEVVLILRSPENTVSHSHLWHLVAIEFGFVVLLNTLGRINVMLDALLGDLFSNYCTIKIMHHASTLDLNQFEDSVFYDKLERARNQADGRATLLSEIFSQIQEVITMVSLGVGLIIFNPWFTVILIFSTIPSFLGEYYFNSKNYILARSQSHKKRQLNYLSSVGASSDTAKEVRLFNLSKFLISRFRNIFRQLFFDNRRLGVNRTLWGSLLALIGTIGYYSAFIYIIQRVLAGALTIGGLTFLLGSIRQLGGVIQTTMKRFSTVSQGALYLRDFFDFFHIKSKIPAPANPRPFPNPIKVGFTFENVGFKYFNSARWANRHLSFTLHAGEKLALVGENGAGKTTLVKLLVRLYEPTEGRILLDGYDLKEYDLADLRRHTGIIFQDFLRYQMTASENIAVGNIDEKENKRLIVRSAEQSQANIIIEKLPEQYDQMLGRHFSRGIELSGGEWQKVALARAYMRDAQIMILDEPTAALDARSEYEVFERFSELTKEKSAILISHRFSTVRMADRILVLEKGELLEMGSHEELLDMDGRYAELFQLQARGYR